MVTLVEVTPFKCVLIGVSPISLSPRFISAPWRGSKCVRSFYEYMSSRVQILFRVGFIIEKSGYTE